MLFRSTYHAHIAQRIDASKRSARAQRDAELKILDSRRPRLPPAAIRPVYGTSFETTRARRMLRRFSARRRHQPRRPPLAKIRPGSPAPVMGPGKAAVWLRSEAPGPHVIGEPKFLLPVVVFAGAAPGGGRHGQNKLINELLLLTCMGTFVASATYAVTLLHLSRRANLVRAGASFVGIALSAYPCDVGQQFSGDSRPTAALK